MGRGSPCLYSGLGRGQQAKNRKIWEVSKKHLGEAIIYVAMATVVIQLKNKVYDENFQKFKRGIYDELLYRHHPVSTVTEMWPYLLHLSFFITTFSC